MSTFYRGVILIKPVTTTERVMEQIEEVLFNEGIDLVVNREFYMADKNKNVTIELTIDQNVRGGLEMDDLLFQLQSLFDVSACLWVDCDGFKGEYSFTKPKGFPYFKEMELLRAGFILEVVKNLGGVNNPADEIIRVSEEARAKFVEAMADDDFVPNEKLLEAVAKHKDRKDGQ